MKLWYLTLCLCLLFLLLVPSGLAVDKSQAMSMMDEAAQTIEDFYLIVSAADQAGGNVSSMLLALQNAGLLLSRANLAFGRGEYDSAYSLAVQSNETLYVLFSNATSLRHMAEEGHYLDFMINIVASSAGAFGVVLGSFAVWRCLKKKYGKVEVDKVI